MGRISRRPDLPVYSVGVHQTATGTTAGLAPAAAALSSTRNRTMDAAAGVRPVGLWLERGSPAAYRRAFIWIGALSVAYYRTAVAGYVSLMSPTLPSLAVLWPPNVLLRPRRRGRLWATPNDGGGDATFHVTLPLGDVHG